MDAYVPSILLPDRSPKFPVARYREFSGKVQRMQQLVGRKYGQKCWFWRKFPVNSLHNRDFTPENGSRPTAPSANPRKEPFRTSVDFARGCPTKRFDFRTCGECRLSNLMATEQS